MAGRSYTATVVVLRKTKLGEGDLVLTMLDTEGRQLRAVAKGARKPASPFASRLELYASADILCSVGRNLDIVKEARSVEPRLPLRGDFAKSAAAAPIAELLAAVTQAEIENPRLYALADGAFRSLCTADAQTAPLLTAAALLKIFAFIGLRPSFDACVACGQTPERSAQHPVRFSFEDGGVLCDSCRAAAISRDAAVFAGNEISWLAALLFSRFDDVAAFRCDPATEAALLGFCDRWSAYHAGKKLKSLDFLVQHAL